MAAIHIALKGSDRAARSKRVSSHTLLDYVIAAEQPSRWLTRIPIIGRAWKGKVQRPKDEYSRRGINSKWGATARTFAAVTTSYVAWFASDRHCAFHFCRWRRLHHSALGFVHIDIPDEGMMRDLRARTKSYLTCFDG